MSEPLAASLERLRNARLESDQVDPAQFEIAQSVSAQSVSAQSDFAQIGLERKSFASQALASRRQLRAQHTDVSEPEVARQVGQSEWVAASQGHLTGFNDVSRGKPRVALGGRAALAGVLALLALSGGIFSAHLLTATAKPVSIVSHEVFGEELTEVPVEAASVLSEPAVPAGATVVVHVAGAVASPGIVELPQGARVAQAVELAGGAVEGAELSAINLARVLVDGEQILIPMIGQVPAPAAEATVSVPPPPDLSQMRDDAGRINLNQASATLLQELPGIGPALAGRIVDYREQVGGFGSVEQLQEVSGIGPAVMNNVRDQVSV